MQEFLPNCRHQLTTLANAWIEEGASSFSIWSTDKLLEKWRNGHPETDETISTPIRLNGSLVGELRVSGANWQGAKIRLKADAELISSLLPQEQKQNNLTKELVDTQGQLVSLHALIDVTRKTMDITSLLNTVSEEAAKMIETQEVFFFLHLEDQKPINVYHPKQTNHLGYLYNLIQSLPSTSKPFIFSGSLNAVDPSLYKNLMLIPFKVFNAKTAVLGFINKLKGEFSASDLKLGNSIAHYTGTQIENILLIRSNIEMARSETEIELAQQIQKSLLPKGAPVISDLDFNISSQPASRIGGDFYDFIFQSNQKLNLIIGDISGKGMPAALLMAMTLKVIRSETDRSNMPAPNIIINRSNGLLYQDYNDAVMFSTIFIGQYDIISRDLHYANAGHSPVIFCPKGQKAELLKADTVPLGMFPEMSVKTRKIQINPGDVLVMATDGINETSNLSARLFGISQLTSLVEKLSELSASEIKDAILQAVQIYGAGKSQEDDRTLIVIKGL
jgi:sigma-B regulation protein RsbU (phosphoserine phosphatase)